MTNNVYNDKIRTGVIYICHSPSGKNYIGQTLNFNRRRNHHLNISKNINSQDYNLIFHSCLRKYGNQMKWGILMKNIPEYELDHFEQVFIEQFDCVVPNGYNIAIGGGGYRGKHSEQHSRKISEALKGKTLSQSHKEKIRSTLVEYYKNNPKTVSLDTREKISHSRKGMTFSKEHIENLSISHMGIRHGK